MAKDRDIEMFISIVGAEKVKAALARIGGVTEKAGTQAKEAEKKTRFLGKAFGSLSKSIMGLIGVGIAFRTLLGWIRETSNEVQQLAERFKTWIDSITGLVSVAGRANIAKVAQGMAPFALRPQEEVAGAFQRFIGGTSGLGWTPEQQREFFKKDVLALGRTETTVPLQQIVDVVSTLYQNAPQFAQQPGKAGNYIIAVEDPAKIDLQGIGTTLPRVLGTLSKELGLSPEQAGGMFAQATKFTGRSEEAATGLRFLLSQAKAPTPELQKIFERLGVDLGEGFLGVMKTIMAAQKSGAITPTELRMFTGTEGMNVFNALANNWAETNRLMQEVISKVQGPESLAQKRYEQILEVPGAPAEMARRESEVREGTELTKPRWARIAHARQIASEQMVKLGWGAYRRVVALGAFDAMVALGKTPEEAMAVVVSTAYMLGGREEDGQGATAEPAVVAPPTAMPISKQGGRMAREPFAKDEHGNFVRTTEDQYKEIERSGHIPTSEHSLNENVSAEYSLALKERGLKPAAAIGSPGARDILYDQYHADVEKRGQNITINNHYGDTYAAPRDVSQLPAGARQ